MKTVIHLLIMIGVSHGTFAQDDARDCKKAVLPFLPPIEGYYLSDYCKFSEFLSYDFAVDRNSRSVHKEGIYRETWYKRKTDNTRQISGLQILKQQTDAIKAAGGESAPDSDGDFFKITYQGKEFWILINANTYSEDQDNYGVISIEGEAINQASDPQTSSGSVETPGSPQIQQESVGLNVITPLAGAVTPPTNIAWIEDNITNTVTGFETPGGSAQASGPLPRSGLQPSADTLTISALEQEIQNLVQQMRETLEMLDQLNELIEAPSPLSAFASEEEQAAFDRQTAAWQAEIAALQVRLEEITEELRKAEHDLQSEQARLEAERSEAGN